MGILITVFLVLITFTAYAAIVVPFAMDWNKSVWPRFVCYAGLVTAVVGNLILALYLEVL